MSTNSVNLYDNVYADFAGDAEHAVRRETYGEDLGQSSWLTAREWLEFADQLGIAAGTDVLEVGSGSGGPAVYLADKRNCRVTGVDVNEHGVRNATALAAARGLTERAQFKAVDASQPLPFSNECFDAVVSNDAMCHIANRASASRLVPSLAPRRAHTLYRRDGPDGRCLSRGDRDEELDRVLPLRSTGRERDHATRGRLRNPSSPGCDSKRGGGGISVA